MRDLREIVRDNEEAVRRFGRTCEQCGELKKSTHERRDPTDKSGENRKRKLCTECFRDLCLQS